MSSLIFSNHGCRLNMYETEAMKDLVAQAGIDHVVVVNTCAVTAVAVRKAKQDIRKLRRQNPDKKIVVTGCAAQIEPQAFAKMPEVDFVIGNTEKMQPKTWASLAGDFSTEPIQVDDNVCHRDRWASTRWIRNPQPRLCTSPKWLRSPLHILHHSLWPW